MINYVGIDYLNHKFKVDLKNLTVNKFDENSNAWVSLNYKNISTFTSKFNNSNTLDFLFSFYTFRVEVSTIGLAVTVTVRDNTTGKNYIVPDNNFNYSTTSLEDLFVYTGTGQYVLSGHLFYNITNEMITELSEERKTYFIRYNVNNIKSGETPVECYNKFCDMLSDLVFKTNPDLENIFNDEN